MIFWKFIWLLGYHFYHLYLYKVLDLNYQKQLLLFSKDALNEKSYLQEHHYI